MKTSTITIALALLLMAPVVICADDYVIAWNAPTENKNGSPITDLEGFHVYARSDTNFVQGVDRVFTLTGGVEPTPTSNSTYEATLTLNEDVWLACTAFDESGNESAFSEPARVNATTPNAPHGLIVVKVTVEVEINE